MENRNKFLLAIGAVAAAYFGKKHLDKRSGSGAIWNLGGEKRMSQQDAFAAYGERQAGLTPWEDPRDESLGLNRFMDKYAQDGYDEARFGAMSENRAVWSQWLASGGDEYAYMERIMNSNIPGRFAGTSSSDDSALSGSGRLKDGYKPSEPQETFSGRSSYSVDALGGKGTLKQDPMSPAGRYGRINRNVDPFSPFRMPNINKF